MARVPFLLFLCALLASATSGAQPRSRARGGSAASGRSRKLFDDGVAALARRDFAAAERSLGDSYRARPSAEALFYLGELALSEQRLLDAQDLMRRFVADPRLGTGEEPAELGQAQRVLAQPMPPHGQLHIVGEDQTLVSVDGHLRGSLPLARPLLLSPGQHTVTLERGARKQEQVMTIAAARYVELRRSATSATTVVLELPSVLLCDSYDGSSAGETPLLHPALEQALRAEQYSLISSADASVALGDGQLGACPESEIAQAQLGERISADYVLSLRAHKQGEDWQLRVQILDVRVGEVATHLERRCVGCSAPKAAAEVGAAALALLLQAKSRPVGTLQISSTPSGAEVRVGERRLGLTPLSRPQWAGSQQLTIALAGYRPETRGVTIPPQQTAEVQVTLAPLSTEAAAAPRPLPPPPPQLLVRPPAPRRPWSRSQLYLATGIAAASVGALMLGFGASGLYMSTQCAGPVTDGSICPESYHTTAAGATLTALGGALVLGGAGLVVIPRLHPANKERPDAREPAAAFAADAAHGL